MGVYKREVKNKRDSFGKLTNAAGTVYDVFIKYATPGGRKTYTKKGFLEESDAQKHNTEMTEKLSNTALVPPSISQGKQKLKDYLKGWIEIHGANNLRSSTLDGYKSNIKNHIIPLLGEVRLNELMPAMIDDMHRQLFEKGLSTNSVKYCQRILSVALEHARKYRYITDNPARDIITKFGDNAETPDPYTVDQMQTLLNRTVGTYWFMMIVLGGLYGLRRNEILGLTWDKVNMERGIFYVNEQLPFQTSSGTTILEKLAPTKSKSRDIPITKSSLPYFELQKQLQEQQKSLLTLTQQPHYENNLVVSQADGSPFYPNQISKNWGRLLKDLKMPHMRFHDLRHTAGTNMYDITGDFVTVGEILGHTLKGMDNSSDISVKGSLVTKRYISVRSDRKLMILEAYHNQIQPPIEKELEKAETTKISYLSR